MSASTQVEVQINVNSNTSGLRQAESELGSFGDTLNNVLQIAGGFTLANVGLQIGQFLRDTAVGTIDVASNFQTMLHTIQGNTAMSNSSLAVLNKTVQDLGSQSGVPLDQLAKGFMHITNEGFSAADATKLLTAAMKGAVDTEGNASDIANSLAVIMHNFGANANQASDYMNKLMQIAAHGNLTLPELASNFQLVSSIAANAHVSLDQLGGTFDVLTRSTGDAARAQFEEERILTSIIEPTKSAKTELSNLSGAIGGSGGTSEKVADFNEKIKLQNERIQNQTEYIKRLTDNHKTHKDVLDKANTSLEDMNYQLEKYQDSANKASKSTSTLSSTGIDLSKDFSEEGLQAKGLLGVLEDVYKATGGNAEALKQLFPDQRAFIGVTALMKDNLKELKTATQDVGKATAEDLLNKEYQTRLQDFSTKMGQLKVDTQELGIALGTPLLKPLGDFVSFLDNQVKSALKGFEDSVKNQPGNAKKSATEQTNVWTSFFHGLSATFKDEGSILQAVWRNTGKELVNIGKAWMNVELGALQIFVGDMNSKIAFFTEFATGNTDLAGKLMQESWQMTWEGIKNIFGGMITAVENMVIGLINFVIGGLNQISVDLKNFSGGRIDLGQIGTVAPPEGYSAKPSKLNSVDIQSLLHPGSGLVPASAYAGPAGGPQGQGGINITNINTFNTQYDPTNFARQQGIAISNLHN